MQASSKTISFRHTAIICGVIIGILSVLTSITKAQGNTDAGTEFLLCFMANEAPGYDQTPNRYQDIYVFSAGGTATVTITCKAFPGFKKTISLSANGSATYRVSSDPLIAFPGHDAIIESSEVIDPTVFKVVSTAPILCYGLSNKQYTGDGFLALPRSLPSTEYIVMSYGNSTGIPGQEDPSEFAVAAFEDSTTVTITPSAQTRIGNPPGKPITFMIDSSGKGVQIQSDPSTAGLDLTGSIVKADKPIAVYGGHVRTEVPTGFTYGDNGNLRTTRNHLAEQMPPLSTWGKFFVAKNTGRPDGDVIRIVASVDNTTIKINGTLWGKPLMKSRFRDTLIPFSPTEEKNAIAIETSAPVMAGMIGHSSSDAAGLGDPFLAMISPLERSFNDLRYFITDDAVNFDTNQQFLLVVTEQSGKDKISVDGVKIPPAVFTNISTPLGGKQYAAALLRQSPGMHDITSENPPDNGMTAIAYGFGQVNAYGYTAGGLIKPLKNSVTTKTFLQTDLENFPNPALGKTTIRFNLSVRAYASVKIYDALGRVVRVVNQSVMSEGAHEFDMTTSGLAAGSYTIELLAPEIGVSEHRSMIVM